MEEVADILEARCTKCHAPGRMAGGWSLTDWDSAHALREPIANALATRAMPPWPAEAVDVAYRADRSLPAEERAALEAWLAADAPAWGEPPRPLEVPPEYTLPRVDATLTLEEPYLPTGITDDVRCFVLPRPVEGDFVTGARIVPSNRAAVHHARLVQAAPNTDLDALEAEDEVLGWDCVGHGRTGKNARHLASFIPGYEPPPLPEGRGFPLHPDRPLILVVHYWLPAFDGTPDQPSVELMLASSDEVEPIQYVLVRDEDWRPDDGGYALEAGETESNHTETFSVAALAGRIGSGDATGLVLHAALPHMHEFGVRTGLQLNRGPEKTLLIDIRRWDFDWQLEYMFETPIPLGENDELQFGCSYAGTGEAVAFGNGAEDEMCSLRLLVTAR